MGKRDDENATAGTRKPSIIDHLQAGATVRRATTGLSLSSSPPSSTNTTTYIPPQQQQQQQPHHIPNTTSTNISTINMLSKWYIAKPPSPPSEGGSPPAAASSSSDASSTFQYPDDPEAREILKPIESNLERLKKTTKNNMPPPHLMIKTKTHVELVKTVMEPIGDFIAAAVRERNDKAEMELRLW
jgi:hypothetical protein